MAEVKEYGYYIEGNKVCIVQKDISFDNDVNSRNYGPDSDKILWKSPLESVTDGLEIQYSYSPEYRETNAGSRVSSQPVSYKGAGSTGKVRFDFSNGIDWSAYIGSYIVLVNAGRWSGIHKIAANSTTNVIYTETSYGEADNTSINFSSSVQYNLAVSFMEDESYEIDLPTYLQKALIYYIKSKFFEDTGDLERREFFETLFLEQVERHNNAKVAGLRLMATSSNAIR